MWREYRDIAIYCIALTLVAIVYAKVDLYLDTIRDSVRPQSFCSRWSPVLTMPSEGMTTHARVKVERQ